jgi:hypothetical protein
MEEAQREAEGREPEYIEFSVVMVAGQPDDMDLDPPLAVGEMIDTFLLVPSVVADETEWQDEIEAYLELGEVECERIAYRQFPRKILPEEEVEHFQGGGIEEVSSVRGATVGRHRVIYEKVVGPK